VSTSTLRRWSRAAAALQAVDGHTGGRLTSPGDDPDAPSSRRERRRRVSRAAGKTPADDVTELESGPARAVHGRCAAATGDDVSVHTIEI